MPFPTENDIYAKYSDKYKHSLSGYYNEMMIRTIIEAERDMEDACMFECDLTDGGLHEHADFYLDVSECRHLYGVGGG